MIDPLFASLAGGLLASALSGVVGNRADSLVTTSYNPSSSDSNQYPYR